MLLVEELRKAILDRKKRDNLTWKEIAQETGVSAPTLSRITRGEEIQPDTKTVGKLVNWLETSVDRFYNTPSKAPTKIIELPKDMSTPEIVEFHLRADKNISPDTAGALAEMFKLVYDAHVKKGLQGGQ